MFKVIELYSYDERHSYGTDWVTDYVCKTDEDIQDIDTLINKVEELGYKHDGQCKMIKDNNKIVLNTRMY